MPNSYSKNSDASNQPNAPTGSYPWAPAVVSTPRIDESSPAKTNDATEALNLPSQQRYATPESGSYRASGNAHDHSFPSDTRRNEQVVEDVSYQASRANYYAERRVLHEQPRTGSIRHPTTQEIAIERDTLEPVALRARRVKSGGIGSKIFFIGSAIITAIATVITVMFLLSSQGGDPSLPTSGTSASPSEPDSGVQSADPNKTSEQDSSQVSSTTENNSDPSNAQGTPRHTPTQIPTVGPLPQPAITLEEVPTTGEELPAERSTPDVAPPAIVPPTDAKPNDEPDRPIETTAPGANTGAITNEPQNSSDTSLATSPAL